MKHVLQIGFGPLGIQTAKYIAQKQTVKTVAVVDVNKDFIGKSLDFFSKELPSDVKVLSSVDEAITHLNQKPDVAIITTVSSLERLIPQVKDVAKHGIPVISTCEELSYPWDLQPKLSEELDALCKSHGIACLGTGINPGFLMDYLPSVMSSVCKEVEQITVERVQDATPRRVPFQEKIGAGLDLEAFKKKELEGTLRHVGLQESIYLLANSMGIKLDRVTEDLNPVIAAKDISTSRLHIKQGDARGVEQIGYGYVNGDWKIKMHFKAAIGEARSFDKITVKGTPSFTSEIDGGVNGDIATCAIAINCINSILKAAPGLHTMADIAAPGYIN